MQYFDRVMRGERYRLLQVIMQRKINGQISKGVAFPGYTTQDSDSTAAL